LLKKGTKLQVHPKILGILIQLQTIHDDNQDNERRCLN
jgi:hypothetical protein